MNGTAQMVIIRVLGNCYNWQTVQSIPTPVNTIVSKARFWRDLWVIQQKDEVFYTSSQKVEWKRFHVNVVDFFPDKEGGNLIGITEGKKVGRDGRLHTTQALLTSIQKNHYCYDCPIKTTQKQLKFHHETSIDELTSILNDISHDPSHIPTIEEMQITDKDKANYLESVSKIDFGNWANHLISEFSYGYEYVILDRQQCADMKRFYQSVANQIDTVGLSTIKTALYNTTGFSTGGAYWFKIEMVNGEGDTLVFLHFNHYHDYAWYLPWMVECDGMRFECRNPALSRWVAACVPKKFYGSEIGVPHCGKQDSKKADFFCGGQPFILGYRTQTAYSELNMVVGLTLPDGHGAVELFGEDEAGEDVREGHLRKGDFVVAAGIHLLRKAVGTADEEHQPLGAANHLLLNELREGDGSEFLAALVQQNNEIGSLDLLEKELTLLLFLLIYREL